MSDLEDALNLEAALHIGVGLGGVRGRGISTGDGFGRRGARKPKRKEFPLDKYERGQLYFDAFDLEEYKAGVVRLLEDKYQHYLREKERLNEAQRLLNADTTIAGAERKYRQANIDAQLRGLKKFDKPTKIDIDAYVTRFLKRRANRL